MSITSHLPALGGDYQNTKSQQEALRAATALTPQQDKQLQVDLKAEAAERRAKREGAPS